MSLSSLPGFLLFVLGLTAVAAEIPRPISLEELRAQRQLAADRQRRIIFNNDGAEPVVYCKGTTPEEFLSYRTTALAGTQVDSIFYCSRSAGFGVFTHATKVGQVFTSKEDRYATNMTAEMLAAGTDPLRVITDFGHQHGIEVFWSMRVNDTHDGSTAEYGPLMFRSNRLKNEHPEWLIGTPERKPKFGAWSAVDYAHPEIRDLAFRYVEEVCRNYAVDGIELDFFRHPVFFQRAALSGTECNDQERQQMTELLRRIRTMTESEGMKRGRPILIAIRAPDSVDYARAIGIDLEKWLADGLCDLFIAGSYFRLSPWSESVALGHRHGVKVYAALDESRVKDGTSKKLRSSTFSYRGRALEAWQGGVDGIYTFNAFNPKSPLWRELGDRHALAAMDRDHFASVLGLGAAAGGALPHADFMHLPRLNAAQPLVVKPDQAAQTSFDLGPAPAAGSITTLRLQFKTAIAPETAVIALNGHALSAPAIKDTWLEFAIDLAALQAGINEVQISVAPGTKTKGIVLTDLQCTVRQDKSGPGRAH